MNLKHLSNDQLHSQTKILAEKERLSTIEVLWHLRENEKRMLFAQRGYRDLKEYCVKELKYSEGSAWRRIGAMRLLKELPEMENKIKTGELNLTQVSMARAHFKETKATTEEKKEILYSLENQTTRLTEKILAEKKPEDYALKPQVVEKPLRGNRLEVTLVLDEELQMQIEEIQILIGKPLTKLELLKMLTKEKLESLRKMRSRDAQPARRKGAAKAERPTSRYISAQTIREVRVRDENQCQYRDPQTGRRCEARLHLHVEHKIPYGFGGSHRPENLELLCGAHNRLRAIQQFGADKMKDYFDSIN